MKQLGINEQFIKDCENTQRQKMETFNVHLINNQKLKIIAGGRYKLIDGIFVFWNYDKKPVYTIPATSILFIQEP